MLMFARDAAQALKLRKYEPLRTFAARKALLRYRDASSDLHSLL
jgi:hypothetical protein